MLSQDYPHLEWVVVDGLSGDQSALDIETNSPAIHRLIREKDDGIADAFNKGIAAASGEAMIFINAGDSFESHDSLSTLVRLWNRDRHGWFAGSARFMTEAGQEMYVRDVGGLSPLRLVDRGCRVVHSSVLIDSALIRSFGGYDVSYRSAMDFDLWVRLISRGFLPQQSSLIASRFYLGGTSSSYSGFEEELRSLRENGLLGARARLWMTARKRAVSRLGKIKRYRLAYEIKERFIK
ncbi:glycosyltransferase [Deinococcus aerius]|uniref:glycosyltransferase n=1 Tax=Deinococcus aerius TaxID=200253 RepID=UPI001F1B746D|nr:glycosyltransferase [Deinococcus aerius]